MIANLDTDKYIEAHMRVVEVMDAPIRTVTEIAAEEGYTERIHGLKVSMARERACIYALRDVMTLMDCGYSLDEALEMWKNDDGPLGMRGECLNAVTETFEEDEEGE